MIENNVINEILGGIAEDLWHYLSRTDKAIVMYGMGNGADKIISVCERYGIEISDFFASDDFVRGQKFHEKTVLKYNDICSKYKNGFIILVSFGSSLPEVIEKIYELAEYNELYIPDVPVCISENDKEIQVFDLNYFREHENEIEKARSLLTDKESVAVFDNVIRFKLTGNPKFLKESVCSDENFYAGLNFEKYNTIMDLGAYRGDTAAEFIKKCPALKTIIAVEPDFRNFKKLEVFASEFNEADINLKIICENKAAYDRECIMEFAVSGNRNSSISGGSYKNKTAEIVCDSPDNIAVRNLGEDVRVDFIKYDVEGAESRALYGSEHLISKSPDLLVSAYHKNEDIFALINQIHEQNKAYKFYMRRKNCIPAWEINLIATSDL